MTPAQRDVLWGGATLMGWFVGVSLLLLANWSHPPVVASGAWADVLRCSQVPDSGKSPYRVVWRVGRRYAGEFTPPDTITLDSAAVNDSVTVEHELLHYLLGATTPPHPVLYFLVRCHLMPPVVGG